MKRKNRERVVQEQQLQGGISQTPRERGSCVSLWSKKKKTTPTTTLSAPSSCAEQHIPPAEPWSCGSQERRNPQQKGLSEAKNENLELRQSGEGTRKQEPRRSLAAEDTELFFVQAEPRALPPNKTSLWDLQPYNRTRKGLWCQDPLGQLGRPRELVCGEGRGRVLS